MQPTQYSCLENPMDREAWRATLYGAAESGMTEQLCQLHPSKAVRGRRQWHPTPVLLPGKSHGRRSLVGCSPWGCQESDTTERLHFHFSLSCIGEGNGNPLQCSCLESPRDRGARGLPSTGSHRVGHNRSDLAAAAATNLKSECMYTKLFQSCPCFAALWTATRQASLSIGFFRQEY